MNPLDLLSERYRATGSMAAEGMGNQLGRPSLDRLAVLVRESVQNSWDARVDENAQVRFEIHGWTLEPKQLHSLRTIVLAHRPPGPSAPGFKSLLDSNNSIHALLIRDTGTTGLGGPTRADEVPAKNSHTDFVDFIRNIGQASDKKFGAGTYGYGKAVLYRSSELKTICVYTRCAVGPSRESRFIACGWGTHFDLEDGAQRGRYTGRHWWGRKGADEVVDPVIGGEADELAKALGIPAFDGAQTGTSILIVAPIFGERHPEDAMYYMASCLLWHCWPKMIDLNGTGSSMSFSVSWNGNAIAIPDPKGMEPLSGFVRARMALEAIRNGRAVDAAFKVVPLSCQKPVRELGHLVLHRSSVRPRPDMPIAILASPFQDSSHHVALMRSPELVVKYLEGPANLVSEIEYSGVFMPGAHVDGAFSKAEPPTHDDWSTQELDPGHDKTFVNVALRRLKEALLAFAAPTPLRVGEPIVAPMGRFADFMAELAPGQDGSGPGSITQPPGGGGSGGGGDGKGRVMKPRVRQLDSATMRLVNGQRILAFRIEVTHVTGSRGTRVSALPRVAILDGGVIEGDPPLGSQNPSILSWESPGGTSSPAAGSVDIAPDGAGVWTLHVLTHPDLSVGIELTGEPL